MENPQSSIEALVMEMKEEIFSELDLYSLISSSAYDTAWLAMIPNPQCHDKPMFKNCLNWVLHNQKEEGFWGESIMEQGLPTIDALPATLACMIALKKWKVGDKHIKKGLAFLHAKTGMLLRENNTDNFPAAWFTIDFLAMVELAQATGLEIVFPDELKVVVSNMFFNRQQLLLQMEGLQHGDDQWQQGIVKYFSTEEAKQEISLLLDSPAAMARAYMLTGNNKCMDVLQNLVQKCPNGVPAVYPIDEELIKLCMVNHIQRLGLAEHFSEEIDDILSQVYRTYCNKNEEQSCPKQFNLVPAKIFKDSLAFRLLRMHGYNVNPWNFCWFLHHEDILNHIEQNKERYINAMYNVYRATDLMFKGEDELEETRSLSRKVLQKAMSSTKGENPDISLGLQKLIEHELNIEWTARLDHLDHRIWIEENKVRPLWIGNASDCRLSCLHNEKLMQLAVENYEFRQSIYRNELEELKRWSKESGLSEMGFGREKTTYCYFATASSCCHLPHNSPVRTIAAKIAILITVADDYFDMKGSLKELKCLTNAIQRWNGKGLTGHGKIIFDALDDLVRDLAALHLHQQGNNITKNLKAIWRETFASWMVESTWSKTGYIPSMAEYLKFGKTSIGSHTLTLIASCFLNPSLPIHKLKPPVIYETVTILLMSLARLLNDIQSYQKEIEDGKMNFVLLHLRENPETNIEDSIAYTEEILKENKKEFIKHVLLDGLNDLPKSCRQLHLSCLKVFHMFFNSKNLFDSDAELFHEIKKAIYIPFEHQIPKVPVQVVPLPPILVDSTPKKYTSVTTAQFTHAFKFHSSSRRRSIIRHQKLPNIVSVDGRQKVLISKMSNLCLI